MKEEAVTYFFRLPVNTEQQAGQEQEAEDDEVARAARRALPANDPNKVTGVGATPAKVAFGGGGTSRTSAAAASDDGPGSDGEEADTGSAAAFLADAMVDTPSTPDEARLQYSSPDSGGAAGGTTSDPYADQDVGRNDPCPCGSGQKYKKCHGG